MSFSGFMSNQSPGVLLLLLLLKSVFIFDSKMQSTGMQLWMLEGKSKSLLEQHFANCFNKKATGHDAEGRRTTQVDRSCVMGVPMDDVCKESFTAISQ